MKEDRIVYITYQRSTNPIEIEKMSGVNSDSVEGKYEIAELVEINNDEINSMKFPGSLLLTPHNNHVPLSLSFIGKGNSDQRDNLVIDPHKIFFHRRHVFLIFPTQISEKIKK